MSTSPFHEGERRVQQRVGELQEADRNAPMIAAHIPAGAIPFLEQQSLLVLAIIDNGAMWCLPLVGMPGWIAVTRGSLHLDLEQTVSPVDDRILKAAEAQQQVGGVALDFTTRRRLRVNGRLKMMSPKLIVLTVAEAYPNCPKYITQRTVAWSEEKTPVPSLRQGVSLTDDQRAALSNTDVLFIATQHPGRGLDASHRGGNPGFVESPTSSVLRFLDYPGNSIYNTLGNLEIDTRVGILLPSFSSGEALAISGTASVSYEDHGHTRWTTVEIERWTTVPFPVREKTHQLSPFNP